MEFDQRVRLILAVAGRGKKRRFSPMTRQKVPHFKCGKGSVNHSKRNVAEQGAGGSRPRHVIRLVAACGLRASM
jgi:hypothetical protein